VCPYSERYVYERSAIEIAFPSVCLSASLSVTRVSCAKTGDFCRICLHHVINYGLVDNNDCENVSTFFLMDYKKGLESAPK